MTICLNCCHDLPSEADVFILGHLHCGRECHEASELWMLVLIEYNTEDKHANTLCGFIILFQPLDAAANTAGHLLPVSP